MKQAQSQRTVSDVRAEMSELMTKFTDVEFLMSKDQRVTDRILMTSLWMMGVSYVLDMVEDSSLIEFLDEILAVPTPIGLNADSPVEILSDAQTELRITVASGLSRKIVRMIDAHVEAKYPGMRNVAIRTVVDGCFDYLRGYWGGRHFRRIVIAQCEAIGHGHFEVVLPEQPEVLSDPLGRVSTHSRRREPSGEVGAARALVVPSIPTVRLSDHLPALRSARIRIDWIAEGTSAGYAFALEAVGNAERSGMRMGARGTTPVGAGGLLPLLLALAQSLPILGENRCRIYVSTSSRHLIKAMEDPRGRATDSVPADLWSEIDAMLARHDVVWERAETDNRIPEHEWTDRALRGAYLPALEEA